MYICDGRHEAFFAISPMTRESVLESGVSLAHAYLSIVSHYQHNMAERREMFDDGFPNARELHP